MFRMTGQWTQQGHFILVMTVLLLKEAPDLTESEDHQMLVPLCPQPIWQDGAFSEGLILYFKGCRIREGFDIQSKLVDPIWS